MSSPALGAGLGLGLSPKHQAQEEPFPFRFPKPPSGAGVLSTSLLGLHDQNNGSSMDSSLMALERGLDAMVERELGGLLNRKKTGGQSQSQSQSQFRYQPPIGLAAAPAPTSQDNNDVHTQLRRYIDEGLLQGAELENARRVL